jgi:hypothetical protein
VVVLLGVFVDLGEFGFGAGETDLEAFDFAEPAFVLGFGDAGGEVVADLDQAGSLGGVGPQERASDTGVFMDAGRSECPTAGADGDLAPREAPEELLPFLVGGDSVFLGGP